MLHRFEFVSSFILFCRLFISILCLSSTQVVSTAPSPSPLILQVAFVCPVILPPGAPAGYTGPPFPPGPYSEQVFAETAGQISSLIPLAFEALNNFRQEIANVGGIPLHDGLGTTALLNFTFINVPLNARMLTDMSHMIANGTYGEFQIVLPVYSLDYTRFALACDIYKTCLVLSNWPSHPADYICQIQTPPLPATLPPDCIARGRREGLRRFDSLLGALSDFSVNALGHLTQAQQLQEKTLAFIYSADPNDVYLYQFIVELATDLGMQPGYSYMVSNAQLANGQLSQQQIASIVDDVIQADPDGLFYIAEGTTTKIMDENFFALINYMKSVDYVPRAFHALNRVAATVSCDPALCQYMFDSTVWTPLLRGANFRAFNTSTNLEIWPAQPGEDCPQVYTASLSAWNPPLVPTEATLTAIFSYLGVVLQKLVEVSGTIDPQSMLVASRSISLPTLYGLLQFDGMGRRVAVSNDQVVLQLIGDNWSNEYFRFLQPVSIGEAAVFPMPKWSERVYVQGSYSGAARFDSAAEKALLALSSLAILLVVVCAILTFLLRNAAVIKASAPVFLFYFCGGAILLLMANFFQVPSQSDSFCQAQIWLLSVGFSCMFTPLFIKTLRIYLIFNQNRLQVLKLSNTKLTIILLCILSFDIILNVIWMGTGNMVTEYVSVDIYRPSYDYESCVSSAAGQAFAYVSLVGKGILILGGLIITWMSRTVSEQFNETSYLAASIYATTLVASLFLPIVVSTLVDSRMSQYAIRALGIIVITFSNICIIFLPKFLDIYAELSNVAKLSNGWKSGTEVQKQRKYAKNNSGNHSHESGGSNPGAKKYNSKRIASVMARKLDNAYVDGRLASPQLIKLDQQITQLYSEITKQEQLLEKLLETRANFPAVSGGGTGCGGGTSSGKGAGGREARLLAPVTTTSTPPAQTVKSVEAAPSNPPTAGRNSLKSGTSDNFPEVPSNTAIPANQMQGETNGIGNGSSRKAKSLRDGPSSAELLPNAVEQ